MKLYFYRSAPEAYTKAFSRYYLPQNLKALRLLSRVWLLIALLVLASDFVFQYAAHYSGAAFYRVAYYSYAVSGAAVWFLDRWLGGEETEQNHRLYRLLCLGYAFVFAVTCLLMSVAVQGSPVNNMTMYLLGLSLVATLFVLELREVLVLATLVELTFVVGVAFLDLPLERVIMNQTGSLFLILFFFLISRLNYSFRVNHFMQLRLIEAKNEELNALNKAKTDILGIVAHDLRGPFGNIEMMAKMLQKNTLPAEQQARFYDMILKSCQSSKGIINDLLDMARFEQEEPFELVPVDLRAFVDTVQQEWQLQLKESRSLSVQCSAAPLLVNLNQERFRRVLDNLISNAVKFTQEQGHIQVQLSQQQRQVLLCISDDGVGVPPEMRPHLFSPFSKAGRKGVRGEHSVGLGLSIARKLVELHQGTIEIDNEQQQGASFRILLPACS